MAAMVNNCDANVDSAKDNVYKLLVEVFESSILEADLTDSIDNLIQLYESFSSQGFESSFKDILMLTVSESRRSKDVEKIFRFISEFVVSLDNKYRAELKNNRNDSDDAEDEEYIHPFLKYLFNLLQEWSEASLYVVRFRSCQLLYIIFTHVLDAGAGEIDIETYQKIANLIHACRRDVSANVRAYSVLLAKFFQDPSDHNDPVIAALCWQLQTDPNAQVRRNILDILGACEETIIPVTKRFLQDKNYLVRNSALLHICHRISPRSFTPEFRILILNQCFQDTSDTIRRNAEQKLIPMWFRAYGDKLCVFFKSLRLGNDCLDKLPFVKPLILQLFKLVKISQILEEIDLDAESALPKCLNGEKIFVWHNFYSMACQQEKLKQFIPKPEALTEYIVKHFKESTFEDVYAYNELVSFTMDVIDILGEEKCENLPPIAIDIMKNLFIPSSVIPYAVTFYCEYAIKETKEIHDDILQTISELMQFVNISSGEEQKKLLIKCLTIFSELLAQDNITVTSELMAAKDDLVFMNIDSDDVDIKREALRSFSLYCLLDLQEAQQFWSFIEETIYKSEDDLKLDAMKGALDILNCHGCKIFGEPNDETLQKFEEVLLKLLVNAVDEEIDIKIVLKGMLKLFLSHHTKSPVLLANLILLMFDPDMNNLKNNILNFLELYGESREEAECLTRAFLNIINMLFNANKQGSYYKVSIKAVSLQLLEFSKLYEDNKNFEVEEKFQDLLVLKLTKKVIKKPSRLPLLDLQEICSSIMPKNVDILIKLKANVHVIVECLGSSLFQKNPFSKKSTNFFSSYLKKIQDAMDSIPVDEKAGDSQRVRSTLRKENFLKTAKPVDEKANDSQQVRSTSDEENCLKTATSVDDKANNDSQQVRSISDEDNFLKTAIPEDDKANDSQQMRSTSDEEVFLKNATIEPVSPLIPETDISF